MISRVLMIIFALVFAAGLALAAATNDPPVQTEPAASEPGQPAQAAPAAPAAPAPVAAPAPATPKKAPGAKARKAAAAPNGKKRPPSPEMAASKGKYNTGEDPEFAKRCGWPVNSPLRCPVRSCPASASSPITATRYPSGWGRWGSTPRTRCCGG